MNTTFNPTASARQSVPAGLLPDPTEPLAYDWRGAVHDRFAEQAALAPDRTAIIDTSGAWTYAEVEAYSTGLADHLRASGIKRQDVVVVYGHRSASLVWGLLAILKAGAAFLILDPRYPVLRLIECIRIAEPRGWLEVEAAGGLPQALEDFITGLRLDCRLRLPSLSSASGLPLRPCANEMTVEVKADDLAYVAFTSGTTGGPKGVIGDHGPLSHFISWHVEKFGLHASDRFSLLSGLSHDPLLRDIFTPLCIGATLCIPDPDDVSVPGRLAAWISEEKISVVHLTPALGQLIAEPGGDETSDKHVLPTLRYLFFSGDVLTVEDVARIQRLAPSAVLVNFYGATETPQAMAFHIVEGDGTSVQTVEATEPGPKRIVPLGKGIDGVQLLVLAEGDHLAGVGEVGEIYVRTPYLTRGYIKDDLLTAERYIANPFRKATADRLYKTGDLGRYLADGSVAFLGRIDHQVKIRGFRIELSEVEAALRRHTSILEAAVMAREDEGGEKHLIAYIVPRAGLHTSISELRRHLAESLPDYMIPASFLLMESLPLTPNGKLDHKALPAPDFSRPALDNPFAAPTRPAEETLCSVWGEILRIDGVGVNDSFFELGGNSLTATRIISKVREAFEVEISMQAFFEAPTVAGLAHAIEVCSAQQCNSSRANSLGGFQRLDAQALLANLDVLSDEDIESLLGDLQAETEFF